VTGTSMAWFNWDIKHFASKLSNWIRLSSGKLAFRGLGLPVIIHS
jgi:hypothetical protein